MTSATSQISQVNTSAADAQEPSTGKLVKQMTGQVSTLRRDELKPAQVEMTRKVRQAGLGAGMLAGVAALMTTAGSTRPCAVPMEAADSVKTDVEEIKEGGDGDGKQTAREILG